MSKKLFLTGASGFLGGNFIHKYSEEFKIFGAYNHNSPILENVKPVQIDLSDSDELTRVLDSIKPDYILHLAALSAPDACENNPDLSYSCNVSSAINLATYCSENNIPLVIASTDMVFDGENPFYSEDSQTNPINLYGKHKLEAEMKSREIFPELVICRLPLLYGKSYTSAKNTLLTILDTLNSGKELKLFTDQYRTPASASEACEGLKLALNMKSDTIHLGGNDHLSRFEMGQVICEEFGFDKKLLIPVLQNNTTMIAQRPIDVSLNNDKAKNLGWMPTSFREEISKIALMLFILCTSLFAGNAQVDIAKMPHTLLWKIEGNNGQKPSYLYGTMHTNSDKAFHLMDSVIIAIKACPAFALEINGDSLDPMSMQSEILLPDGQTLSSLYSKEDYKMINDNFTKATGYPMALFDKIKPIYVYVTIGESAAKGEKGLFLDLFLFNLAKQENKASYGLEKAEDQLKLLRDIPMQKQLEMLKEAAKDIKSEKKKMKENFDFYANADFAAMMKDEESDTSMGKDFMEKFITVRNRNMADRADKLIRQQPIFMAIGAAHLPGKNGVLNLLHEKGYKVSPVISKKRIAPAEVKAMVKKKE